MSSSNSPCAACKLLRRKCTQGCVFAPYFPPDQPAKFANVHKVFGASNAAKLLKQVAPGDRSEAAATVTYEAQARLRDPVYGCVAHIFALQQQVMTLQAQLASLKAHAPPAPQGVQHQNDVKGYVGGGAADQYGHGGAYQWHNGLGVGAAAAQLSPGALFPRIRAHTKAQSSPTSSRALLCHVAVG